MSELKHTGAPWTLQKLSECWHGYDDWRTFAVRDGIKNHCLAVVGDVDRATAEVNAGNARLMVKAPELLDLLRSMINGEVRVSDKSNRHLSEHDPNVIKARKLIAWIGGVD